MGGLFGSPKVDTSAADKQAAELAKQEREQAAELAARRRAATGRSKTLFDLVGGIDDTLSTALGGGTPNSGSAGGGMLGGYSTDISGVDKAPKPKKPNTNTANSEPFGRGWR